MSRLIHLVALIEKEPRTQKELAQMTGFRPNAVRAHIKALKAQGLINPQGWRCAEGATTNPAVLWGWK